MFEFADGGGGEPAVISAAREALAAMAAAHDSALFALRAGEESTLTDLYEQIQRKLSAARLDLYRRIDSDKRPDSGSAADRIVDRTLADPAWVRQRIRLADMLAGRLADTGSALGEGAISEEHAWVIHVTMDSLRKSLPVSEYERAQAMMLAWAQDTMPLNLGDSRQSDGRWSGVAGDGVCIAFDEIAVVAGSFDDAGAGAVADGVSVPEDVAVDPAEGSLVLLRGKNPPAR